MQIEQEPPKRGSVRSTARGLLGLTTASNMAHHARHSPSLQSFRLRHPPVRPDLADRGGDRQLARVERDALRSALDDLMADRMDRDASRRALGGARDPLVRAAADARGGGP